MSALQILQCKSIPHLIKKLLEFTALSGKPSLQRTLTHMKFIGYYSCRWKVQARTDKYLLNAFTNHAKMTVGRYYPVTFSLENILSEWIGTRDRQ
jgi:hypothetical protein